jgi:CHASE3 domain sensor protein
VSWQPATLVFVAGGTAPYTLAVGRDKAVPAARQIGDVAPGFTTAELRALEQAHAGAAQMQGDAAQRASADAARAQRRLILLWGVLLLGVAAVAWMVWRLLRQAESQG